MEKAKRILGLLVLVSLCPLGFCHAQPPARGVSTSSDAPAAVKEQVERLHSFDPVERRNAAQELGRMGDDAVAAVPVLVRALNDNARLAVRSFEGESSPASVAEAAMLALANIGAPAVDPLIAALGSANPGVRMKAAAALGSIQDPRTIEPLVRLLESDEDSLVQAAAVDSLRKKNDSRALDALLMAEQNASWVVRSLAKSAVEEMRTGEARPGREAQPVAQEGDAGKAVGAGPTDKAVGAGPRGEATKAEATEEDLVPWGGGPAPSEEPDASEPVDGVNHTVQRDETLYRIGRRYGVTWQTLMEHNDLRDPTHLYVGQVLKIPSASEVRLSQGKTSVSGTGLGTETQGEPSGEEETYVVQQGDNLYRIGLRYGVTWQTLMSYNNMYDPAALSAGQVLKIPPGHAARASLTWDGVTTYTVQHGDILSDIGLLFGLSWREIAAFNGLTDPNEIFVGQVLKIPTRRSPVSP
jgi:LysM repeat protein